MKDDYSYWSENLHSAYLFYTLEVDKLNKENKRLREIIKENATWCDACQNSEQAVENCCECWDRLIENNKQALGE